MLPRGVFQSSIPPLLADWQIPAVQEMMLRTRGKYRRNEGWNTGGVFITVFWQEAEFDDPTTWVGDSVTLPVGPSPPLPY